VRPQGQGASLPPAIPAPFQRIKRSSILLIFTDFFSDFSAGTRLRAETLPLTIRQLMQQMRSEKVGVRKAHAKPVEPDGQAMRLRTTRACCSGFHRTANRAELADQAGTTNPIKQRMVTFIK
jgi:hypothetical protein